MAKGKRMCKICGKEYEYCKTERGDGVFRWQDVACCPEHAEEYFAQIAASRGEVKTDSVSSADTTAFDTVADAVDTASDVATVYPYFEENTSEDAEE